MDGNQKLHDFYETHSDEFLKFERVKEKLNQRPDLHAFLLLDSLVPSPNRDMVSGAEHDEIYLDVDPEDLMAVATEEQLIDLHRCGVRCDEDYGLCMFA